MTSIDAFYAMSKVIDVMWFFAGRVDRQQLALSLRTLAQRHPVNPAISAHVVRTSSLSSLARALDNVTPLSNFELQHGSSGVHLSRENIPGKIAAQRQVHVHITVMVTYTSPRRQQMTPLVGKEVPWR